MPKDYRIDFIRAVEQAVAPLNQEQQQYMVHEITKILNNYEITERCTDLVTMDPENERLRKRYLACLVVDGKAQDTIYQYKRILIRLNDFIGKPYTEMGAYDVRFFIACEKDRGLSNRSTENLRTTISAFFQWMTAEDIIPKNPLANVKPIKYKSELRKPFSDVEIDALRSACKTLKERAIVEFLLSSGARVSEVAKMDISDINFKDLSVHIRNGKGNKERITYITQVCAMHLKKYLMARSEPGEALFYNKNHERIRKGGIEYILNELGKRASVMKVHPHRFRRTLASNLAARGMDIQEIQKLLGHSNINTTLAYIYTDDENVQASYKKYA